MNYKREMLQDYVRNVVLVNMFTWVNSNILLKQITCGKEISILGLF